MTVHYSDVYNDPAIAFNEGVIAREAHIDFAAAVKLTSGDELYMFDLPFGAKILDGYLSTNDLDDGTAAVVLSVEVTDDTTTKTLIDGSTVGQAGGFIRPSKTPATEDAIGYVTGNGSFRVRVYVDTTANGDVPTGGGTCRVVVLYTCDLNHGDVAI